MSEAMEKVKKLERGNVAFCVRYIKIERRNGNLEGNKYLGLTVLENSERWDVSECSKCGVSSDYFFESIMCLECRVDRGEICEKAQLIHAPSSRD